MELLNCPRAPNLEIILDSSLFFILYNQSIGNSLSTSEIFLETENFYLSPLAPEAIKLFLCSPHFNSWALHFWALWLIYHTANRVIFKKPTSDHVIVLLKILSGLPIVHMKYVHVSLKPLYPTFKACHHLASASLSNLILSYSSSLPILNLLFTTGFPHPQFLQSRNAQKTACCLFKTKFSWNTLTKNIWLRKLKILTDRSFIGPKKKKFYRHSFCLECSSAHLSHEHLFHASSPSLNITTSSKSPFLAYVVALIIFLYPCTLFSSLYRITEYLVICSMITWAIRCILFTNIFLIPKSEPGK